MVTVTVPPGATVSGEKDRLALGPAGTAGVPVAVADQGPSPAELTARTCTSYCVPLVSPVSTYCRGPEPVQAS